MGKSKLRKKLVKIKDDLTDVIKAMEETNPIELEGLNELKTARIIVWSEIQEMDIN